MSDGELADFEAAQYALRASFFYRAHALWETVRGLVAAALREGAPQVNEGRAGVSKRALEHVRELGIEPASVFAHPDLLIRDPRVIRYFRCLALLPQKGLQRLAFGTTSLEEKGGRLTEERAQQLAAALNGLISLQIESDPGWSVESAETAALLNLGSQINGSWRNAIGEEGSRQVKVLLTSLLGEENAIDHVTLDDGQEIKPPVDSDTALQVREIALKNEYSVRFAPEPDVSVRDPKGLLVGTIEVKYGSDPAGALERYGAARKSFEAAVRENAHVQNVYLANVLTDEVLRRIGDDRLVSEVFEFSRVSVDPDERERFLRFVTRRLLDL